jgi:hypothetical protein
MMNGNSRYLAKIEGPSIPISNTDILFISEMQKRANPTKRIYPN